jgi:hypothetical protein
VKSTTSVVIPVAMSCTDEVVGSVRCDAPGFLAASPLLALRSDSKVSSVRVPKGTRDRSGGQGTGTQPPPQAPSQLATHVISNAAFAVWHGSTTTETGSHTADWAHRGVSAVSRGTAPAPTVVQTLDSLRIATS